MTELCTIGEDTYVYVPDDMELPEQPFNIDVGMESVVLTAELKAEIKALSPHFKLAYGRLDTAKKIRLEAGFLVDGVLFDSDSNARLAYAELAMKFMSDPTFTKHWKASPGVWVDMDATMFQAVYTAGEEHITSVFAWLEAEQIAVDAVFGLG